jgi:hypothetical protein
MNQCSLGPYRALGLAEGSCIAGQNYIHAFAAFLSKTVIQLEYRTNGIH